MHNSVPPASLESEGNHRAAYFHAGTDERETPGKADALRILDEVIYDSRIPHKVLADVCAMSLGNFSKVLHGKQGDALALVDKLPTPLRREFWSRLADLDRADPLARATDDVLSSMLRWVRLTGRDGLVIQR